jgi:hypothetical protein
VKIPSGLPQAEQLAALLACRHPRSLRGRTQEPRATADTVDSELGVLESWTTGSGDRLIRPLASTSVSPPPDGLLRYTGPGPSLVVVDDLTAVIRRDRNQNGAKASHTATARATNGRRNPCCFGRPVSSHLPEATSTSPARVQRYREVSVNSLIRSCAPHASTGSLEKQHHADGECLTPHCRRLRVRRIYRTARCHKGSAGSGVVTGGGFMLYWRTS